MIATDVKEELKKVIDEKQIEKEVKEIIQDERKLEEMCNISLQKFEPESIVKAKVVNILPNDVIVDIGYKSEGFIPIEEFEDPKKISIGDEFEVVFEGIEDNIGALLLSKRKADKIRGWERLVQQKKEGDIVTGTVIRKIKGGLLVDVGVPVFLPASQVDVRKFGDISELIGKEITAKIIKIDVAQKNVVISRKQYIEEQRAKQKKELLEEIAEGQIRKGVVKNITEFGAFVDLGGIDGLLHITDMSWGRINHPSEILSIDQEIEVVVLSVDKERERISLGLKQRTKNPWEDIEKKYPVGSRVKGKVVNVVPYGAFILLEPGIEGLLHVSEMSWTKQIKHASEVVSPGDIVEVVVLSINKEKQEISLGLKQLEENPWDKVKDKYKPGTKVKGVVKSITGYGAFIEIEEGIEGLLHLSDISWTKKIFHPSEVLKKGQEVETVVLSVDPEKKRISLGMKQLIPDPWEKEIPDKYKVGTEVKGVVTKLTNFGAFVEIEKDLEALLHISEISQKKDKSSKDILKVGQTIEAVVVSIDKENRKIALSLKKKSSSE